jgi:5-methylcytosine-specific restriction enzyme A
LILDTKLSIDPQLLPGDTISNDELKTKFKCGSQGGMRRSLKTNTLILVSDHTKSIYEDRWIDTIFHYTGMGMIGDQSLDFAQNKTLAESPSNGVDMYLFEVFEKGRYTFIEKVELAGKPYQENQPDRNDNLRHVWIFPLRIIDQEISVAIPESSIFKKEHQKEREARRLSDGELARRAEYSKKGVGIRKVSTKIFERNQYVAELAKRRAKGICQLCGRPAPFKDKRGNPYLETHHIQWLSEGGEDIIENTVALCPNCHRKMHSLNLLLDQKKLKSIANQQKHDPNI